jgi:hypothetical protein
MTCMIFDPKNVGYPNTKIFARQTPNLVALRTVRLYYVFSPYFENYRIFKAWQRKTNCLHPRARSVGNFAQVIELVL